MASLADCIILYIYILVLTRAFHLKKIREMTKKNYLISKISLSRRLLDGLRLFCTRRPNVTYPLKLMTLAAVVCV